MTLEKRDNLGRFVTHTNYGVLMNIPIVKDWIQFYQPSTRKQYIYFLGKACDFGGVSPTELLALEKGEAKRIIKGAAQVFFNEGKTNSANRLMKTVKAFFEANDKELKFKRSERIKIKKKRIDYEYIPTKTEVYRMADLIGNPRDRALIICLLQSGVRANCICKWTYGLVRKWLYPEIKLPVHIKVTGSLDTKITSQGLGYYYAFLHREASEALKEFIEYRKKNGWIPHDNDFLFISRKGKNKPITTNRLSRIIKYGAKKAGLSVKGVWTHCLRKSFRKVLNSAINAGILDEDTKESLMGHRLPGARGNYFDSHDVDEIAGKYLRLDFSREGGTSRLNGMSQDLSEAKEEIQRLKIDLSLALSQRANLVSDLSVLRDRLQKLENEKKFMTRDIAREVIREQLMYLIGPLEDTPVKIEGEYATTTHKLDEKRAKKLFEKVKNLPQGVSFKQRIRDLQKINKELKQKKPSNSS